MYTLYSKLKYHSLTMQKCREFQQTSTVQQCVLPPASHANFTHRLSGNKNSNIICACFEVFSKWKQHNMYERADN